MALEIERRFLVQGEQWRAHVAWQARLQQGYLSASAEGITVRVRRNGPKSWLTIKAPPSAASTPTWVRHEFEYEIPVAEAEQMLSLAPVRLSKQRYGLDLPGGDWVLDVFEADNAPLVVAEVELTAPDQPLQIPRWCVLELTGRHELSNAALAQTPLARWQRERRQELLAALAATGEG